MKFCCNKKIKIYGLNNFWRRTKILISQNNRWHRHTRATWFELDSVIYVWMFFLVGVGGASSPASVTTKPWYHWYRVSIPSMRISPFLQPRDEGFGLDIFPYLGEPLQVTFVFLFFYYAMSAGTDTLTDVYTRTHSDTHTSIRTDTCTRAHTQTRSHPHAHS